MACKLGILCCGALRPGTHLRSPCFIVKLVRSPIQLNEVFVIELDKTEHFCGPSSLLGHKR